MRWSSDTKRRRRQQHSTPLRHNELPSLGACMVFADDERDCQLIYIPPHFSRCAGGAGERSASEYLRNSVHPVALAATSLNCALQGCGSDGTRPVQQWRQSDVHLPLRRTGSRFMETHIFTPTYICFSMLFRVHVRRFANLSRSIRQCCSIRCLSYQSSLRRTAVDIPYSVFKAVPRLSDRL